jgi:hypothetical protein
MTVDEELLAQEDEGWRALSSDGAAAAAFYGRVLDDRIAMLLPGGLKIDDRDKAIEMMSGQPWDWYRIEDGRVVSLTDDVAVVLYTAAAQRGDDPVYSAQMASTWVRRDGEWRLAIHLQTPIAA